MAGTGAPSSKYIYLLILMVQNSALVLTMRYSRILPGPRYLTSTAVILSEAIKSVISLIIHLREKYDEPPPYDLLGTTTALKYSLKQLWADLFGAKSGFIKLLVPAALYALQNNLQFVAASNLDAATFQVTYQCKILTTALFAVLLLRQSLSSQKWLSLLVLTGGVACVQIPSSQSNTTPQEGNSLVGLVAVAISCLLSGLAGVYFERILKSSNGSSIWTRNVQMSIGCMIFAVSGAAAWDAKAIRSNGFFQGYNAVVVMTLCLQAAGGLVVAMVIKHADNILKGFATSLSIILSTVVSIFAFNFVVTIYFLIGTFFVFAATYLYALPDPQPRPDLEMLDEKELETIVVEKELYESSLDERSSHDEKSSTPRSSFENAQSPIL